MSSDLYVKPTDTHQYLHANSSHPGHTKRSIAYSQARRITTICSDTETAKPHLENLVQSLTARGHSEQKVRSQVNKALDYKPQTNPTTTTQPKPDRVNFVLTYDPRLPDLSRTIRDNFHLLQINPILKNVFVEPPRLAFRNAPNLMSRLCRAKLPRESAQAEPSCGPCSVKGRKPGVGCCLCHLLPFQKSIKSAVTGEEFPLKIQGHADCDSVNVVYCITCTKCNKQYVGGTENYRKRTRNHKSCITNKQATNLGCRLLYDHFRNSPDHSIVDAVWTIIEVCKRPTEIDQAEYQWQRTLKALEPEGFCINDGTFCQNRKPRRDRK